MPRAASHVDTSQRLRQLHLFSFRRVASFTHAGEDDYASFSQFRERERFHDEQPCFA